MNIIGRASWKNAKNTLPNNSVVGWERTFGFYKSSPTKCSESNKAAPVRMSVKLTRIEW